MRLGLQCIALLSLVLLVLGCQTNPNGNKASGNADLRDDDSHVGPAIETVQDMMRSKLAHAHGVLEGLARQNYDQIIANANSLHELAGKSAWGVHRTMEYNLYSDQFRWHTSELKRHAQEKKLHAATLDYMQMTMTCVRCHDYMNQENLIFDESQGLARFFANARPVSPGE